LQYPSSLHKVSQFLKGPGFKIVLQDYDSRFRVSSTGYGAGLIGAKLRLVLWLCGKMSYEVKVQGLQLVEEFKVQVTRKRFRKGGQGLQI